VGHPPRGLEQLHPPGLTQNVELNIQIRREVELLQQWFERHWNEADDISRIFFV